MRSELSTASGSTQRVIGYCTLPINFKNVTKNIDFYLTPSLTQKAYFGVNFWREFALAPDIIPALSSIETNFSNPNGNLKIHDLGLQRQITFNKLGCLPGEDCIILSNADTLRKVGSSVRKNLTIAHERAVMNTLFFCKCHYFSVMSTNNEML